MAWSALAMIRNKISRDQLRRGDHIYTDRKLKGYLPEIVAGYLQGIVAGYFHHGIVVEVLEDITLVMHFQNLSREPTMCTHHPRCTTDYVSFVRLCCLDCFLKGKELYLFPYDQGFTAIWRTTRSASPRGTEVAVVDRAWECHRRQNRGRWSILNNCESFAYYCSTGNEYFFGSKQVLRGGFLALKLI